MNRQNAKVLIAIPKCMMPYKYCPNCGAEMVIKSCSTCKHDGELVCATHGCHNKERYEVKA